MHIYVKAELHNGAACAPRASAKEFSRKQSTRMSCAVAACARAAKSLSQPLLQLLSECKTRVGLPTRDTKEKVLRANGLGYVKRGQLYIIKNQGPLFGGKRQPCENLRVAFNAPNLVALQAQAITYVSVGKTCIPAHSF